MKKELQSLPCAPYHKSYIALVDQYPSVVDALKETLRETKELLSGIDESKASSAYAPGKWTIKELILHLSDAERIFCNRALRFARMDETGLPGFDHDEYVKNSSADARSFESILAEFNAVRLATIALFEGFTPEMLEQTGKANDALVSVLAIGYIAAGHEKHHVNVIRERYL
ncbi:MAG: DinB family protein [Flavobacteriales bacterium]|nr:DinB family protein [Flavobacteriales bacterium]